jgi:hypothetical protein
MSQTLVWISNIRCCGVFFCLQRFDVRSKYPSFLAMPNNSYKLITNMAWVHARLCKLQKRVHLTRSRKLQCLPVACPWSLVLSGYSGFFHHIKCLPVTVILKALWTRTENLDLPILNKRSIVVSVQFPLVPTATVEYKFDCIYLRKNNS